MGEEIVYAFIDGQNLYQEIKAQGWKLDYHRLRVYLADKYQVSKALIFLGFLPKNRTIYRSLQKAGFTLVFKKVLRVRIADQVQVKGNIDADLVLHAAQIELANYDKAIFISGDGDFYGLYEFLISKGKLYRILLPNEKRFSALLRDFRPYLVPLNRMSKKLRISQ